MADGQEGGAPAPFFPKNYGKPRMDDRRVLSGIVFVNRKGLAGLALPEGLGDVAAYPALLAELMRRGWSDADVAKLAGGNMLRVMSTSERVAARMRGTPPEIASPLPRPG